MRSATWRGSREVSTVARGCERGVHLWAHLSSWLGGKRYSQRRWDSNDLPSDSCASILPKNKMRAIQAATIPDLPVNRRLIIIGAIPLFFFLGLDVYMAAEGANFPLMSWVLVAGNAFSALLYLRSSTYATIGVLFFSFLLMALPPAYSGNSATIFYLIYPMIALIIKGSWLSFTLISTLYAILVYNNRDYYPLASALVSLGFLLLFALPGGLILRSAHDSALRSRVSMERAQEVLVERLATTIHDTALTSLTREVLRMRTLALQTDDPTVADELRSIEEGLRQTSNALRTVFLINESEYYSHESIEDILREGQKMLQSRGCQMELNIEQNVTEKISLDDFRFLVISLREGLTNAAKYAEPHTLVTVDLSTSKTNVDLGISSIYSPQILRGETFSSQQGIKSLENRAQQLGIDFFAGQVGDKWVHSMSIPVQNKGHLEEAPPISDDWE